MTEPRRSLPDLERLTYRPVYIEWAVEALVRGPPGRSDACPRSAYLGHEMTEAKDRMVLATLELLRQSGLAGAGINNVVDASGAPKGSVYHYFPGGKRDLVASALVEAERRVGDGLWKVDASQMYYPAS